MSVKGLTCETILLIMNTVKDDLDANICSLGSDDIKDYAEAIRLLAEAFRVVKES